MTLNLEKLDLNMFTVRGRKPADIDHKFTDIHWGMGGGFMNVHFKEQILAIPDTPDVKLRVMDGENTPWETYDYADEHLHHENKHLPYWAHLWPSSEYLGQVIARLASNRLVQDRRVLDLGSGTGYLGGVAAQCGAKEVFLADHTEEAVRLSMSNMHLNGFKQTVFNWNPPPRKKKPQVKEIEIPDSNIGNSTQVILPAVKAPNQCPMTLFKTSPIKDAENLRPSSARRHRSAPNARDSDLPPTNSKARRNYDMPPLPRAPNRASRTRNRKPRLAAPLTMNVSRSQPGSRHTSPARLLDVSDLTQSFPGATSAKPVSRPSSRRNTRSSTPVPDKPLPKPPRSRSSLGPGNAKPSSRRGSRRGSIDESTLNNKPNSQRGSRTRANDNAKPSSRRGPRGGSFDESTLNSKPNSQRGSRTRANDNVKPSSRRGSRRGSFDESTLGSKPNSQRGSRRNSKAVMAASQSRRQMSTRGRRSLNVDAITGRSKSVPRPPNKPDSSRGYSRLKVPVNANDGIRSNSVPAPRSYEAPEMQVGRLDWKNASAFPTGFDLVVSSDCVTSAITQTLEQKAPIASEVFSRLFWRILAPNGTALISLPGDSVVTESELTHLAQDITQHGLRVCWHRGFVFTHQGHDEDCSFLQVGRVLDPAIMRLMETDQFFRRNKYTKVIFEVQDAFDAPPELKTSPKKKTVDVWLAMSTA